MGDTSPYNQPPGFFHCSVGDVGDVKPSSSSPNSRPYYGKPMVNSPLIRDPRLFLGGPTWHSTPPPKSISSPLKKCHQKKKQRPVYWELGLNVSTCAMRANFSAMRTSPRKKKKTLGNVVDFKPGWVMYIAPKRFKLKTLQKWLEKNG